MITNSMLIERTKNKSLIEDEILFQNLIPIYQNPTILSRFLVYITIF